MHIRKLLIGTICAVLVLAGLGASTAGAQSYGGNQGITCSPSVVAPGETITCTATGFEPFTPVTFSYNPVIGTVDADANGSATISFAAPNTLGPLTVTATGLGIGSDSVVAEVSVSTSVTVATGSDTLPVTGSDSSLPLAQIAVGLIMVGGLTVLIARKRRQPAASV